jgi:subtilase family serine protease
VKEPVCYVGFPWPDKERNKLYVRHPIIPFHLTCALLVVASPFTLAAAQIIPTGGMINQSTPAFVNAATTKNLGPENESEIIEVSIWLNLHNRAELDSLARDLYDPNSSRFHNWLKREDFAQFAPTAAEAAEVARYFTSHGLRVTMIGPNNRFVRAQGTVANVSKAFHVSLNRYQVEDKVFRSNSGNPLVEGATAALVQSIAGLDNVEVRHPLDAPNAQGVSPGSSSAVSTAAASTPTGFTSYCFPGPVSETIGTPGQYPYGVYKGNLYYSSLVTPGCGYTPSEIQKAYNLTALYNEGYDGTGQTVVIIDWCGSLTIRQDANAFSARFGLPPLTASNFKIINYPGPSTCAAYDPEVNIDVEWVHAIAPRANIVLLITPSANLQDLDEALYYAASSGLGNVISGSYGTRELFLPPSELALENLTAEIAAVHGASANFSTGDLGDLSGGQGFQTSVWVPAAAPYATAVGGTTLALNKDNTIKWEAGWGNNKTQLTFAGLPLDPPFNLGFLQGSGGGPSGFFAKPSYQKNLPGLYRQIPDISWLADPFTGAIIEITLPGTYPPVLQAFGGTSLSCPMFSALWAIANQEAGAPLGQAAPHLYSMPKGTITDILPVGSATNVTAAIVSSAGQTDSFSAAVLAQPLEKTKVFYSAIWDNFSESQDRYVLTFGTDTGLIVTPGWDNVTGLGTPNGKAFADYFNPAK